MFHASVLRHRLFFAVRPPLPQARQMIGAAHWFGDRCRMLQPEHVHVTIDILDDMAEVDDALVRRLRSVGDAVALAPFSASFDLAVGSPRSIALRARRRIPGFHALRAQICERRAAAGIPERRGYRFSPHKTLGYWRGEPFSEPIAPVEWEAREFVLIHSYLGQTLHEIIGRWRLRGEKEADQPSLF